MNNINTITDTANRTNHSALGILLAVFIFVLSFDTAAGQSASSQSARLTPNEEKCFSISYIPDSIFNRMQGKSWAKGCKMSREDLRYLTILHTDEKGVTHHGELVCNKAIAQDLIDIFKELYAAHYPIHSVRLIDDYDGSDEMSMRANNTSSFNWRTTATGQISRHARGMAIDINPLWNPCIYLTGKQKGVVPANAGPYVKRTPEALKKNPAPITTSDLCYRLFKKHGFRWGGVWKTLKDYQHFDR